MHEWVPLVVPGQHIPTADQLMAVFEFRRAHPEMMPPGTMLNGDIANYAISWYNSQNPPTEEEQ